MGIISLVTAVVHSDSLKAIMWELLIKSTVSFLRQLQHSLSEFSFQKQETWFPFQKTPRGFQNLKKSRLLCQFHCCLCFGSPSFLWNCIIMKKNKKPAVLTCNHELQWPCKRDCRMSAVDQTNLKGLDRCNLRTVVMVTGTKIRLYPILLWFTMVIMTSQYN